MPQEVLEKFKKAYDAALYCSLRRSVEMSAISSAFHALGIEFFTIKGWCICHYYPVPQLRTMGDLDLVIHREDRMKANEYLLRHGYSIVTQLQDREWQYEKNGLEYELHDHLIYDETINLKSHEEFFNDFWPYVREGKLDVSFHFLFLLAHLRKHLMNSGAGFRMFMDLALMSMKETELNWSWIRERLDKLEIKEFARICFALIERWFGIKMPIESAALDEGFYEKATQSVFANGIFGFDNKENRKNMAVNKARRGSTFAMLSSVADSIFPSYHRMLNSPHYRYLDDRPYLLPVAWTHRMLRGLKNYNKAVSLVSFGFATKKEVSRRDEYLKKWGL